MATFSALVTAYLLGGLTFLPLVLVSIFLHAYLTFPTHNPSDVSAEDASNGTTARRNSNILPDYPTDLPPELKKRVHEPDVAAAHFAVTREFVPGGVNGKPPERTTPAGTVQESPSVYQSMYRSIFDWGKGAVPSSADAKGGTTAAGKGKKVRNVFFVVLRHGHLMLYDDPEQLEVRHVVSLAHHTVDVYAGGEKIPEGELWIKRNCIRLQYSGTAGDLPSKPFFLFSDNCSQKEDFYHALLQSKDRSSSSGLPEAPEPLRFEHAHIVKLVQSLHATEENLQYRWLNALIGRIFLALYKTQNVEDFIRMKFTKKIARVSKPAFISHIKLQKVDMGDSAPLFTNLKLRELTVDGDLIVESDIRYVGSFRIEIAATARIELGQRFKAREVSLILAGICKKLSGRMLLKIKPPPSNRMWISFETMPQIDMSIEPIVSSRQITYGIVLRAIESRIREVMAETLVYPNWDDIPFHDSSKQDFRGGIWANDQTPRTPAEDAQTKAAKAGLVDQFHDVESGSEDEAVGFDVEKEKSMSMPSLVKSPPAGIGLRHTATAKTTVSPDEGAVSSATEKIPRKPKAMRSHSFASAASPVLSVDNTTMKPESPMRDGHDAAAGLKHISSRSPVESPVGSLDDTTNSLMERVHEHGSFSSNSSHGSQKSSRSAHASTRTTNTGSIEDADSLEHSIHDSTEALESDAASQMTTTSSIGSGGSTPGHLKSRMTLPDPRNLASADKRASVEAGLGTMTAAAKKFFANRRQNNGAGGLLHTPPVSGAGASSPDSLSAPNTPSSIASLFKAAQQQDATQPQLGSPARPMGRGQPLPPPGTPLPPPRSNKGWHTGPLVGIGSIGGMGFSKKRSTGALDAGTSTTTTKLRTNSADSIPAPEAAPPPLPARPGQASEESKAGHSRGNSNRRSSQRSATGPPLASRRKRSVGGHEETLTNEPVFVVEAPGEETGEDEVVGSMELDEAHTGTGGTVRRTARSPKREKGKEKDE